MITIAAVLNVPSYPYKIEHGEHETWSRLGSAYAYRLFHGVRRHTTDLDVEPRCVLFTNAAERVQSVKLLGVEIIELTHTWPGWWSKLNIFEPGVLTDHVLYLDLDVVVRGSLREILELRPDPIMMLHNQEYPGFYNASVMYMRNELLAFLWHEFMKSPQIASAWTRGVRGADASFIADRVTMKFGKRALNWPTTGSVYQIDDEPRNWRIPFIDSLLPHGHIMNGRVQLEAARQKYSRTRLVYGDAYRRIHDSRHELYREHWHMMPASAERNADDAAHVEY